MRACVVMISMNQTTSTPASPAPPSSSGYADVNGLHLYYEEYDEQRSTTTKHPLVLLHGGMLNIELNFADLITRLAPRHRVIAVELQGHGRTADIERVISPANSASDVIALLDHLGIDHAHVLGHSMGGAVAMELAVSHPDRVLSVVPISITVRPEGMHEDFSDPAKMATSTRMPTADDMAAMKSTYQRLSPHPEHFDEFLAALSSSQEDLRGWSDEQLSAVRVPVLFIIVRPRLHHHRARRADGRQHAGIAAAGAAGHDAHAGHPPCRRPRPGPGGVPQLRHDTSVNACAAQSSSAHLAQLDDGRDPVNRISRPHAQRVPRSEAIPALRARRARAQRLCCAPGAPVRRAPFRTPQPGSAPSA